MKGVRLFRIVVEKYGGRQKVLCGLDILLLEKF